MRIADSLTRRFIERLLPYAYWPWEPKTGPKYRIPKPEKNALVVTATACPAGIARLLMPGTRRALKIAAKTMGARVIQSLHFDCIAATPESPLSDKARCPARQVGARLTVR